MSSSSRSNHPFAEFPHVKMMGGKTLKWKAKSGIEVAPSCPRCFSSNTKFCYYNNYSVSQPRYFCKACRRYWTKGGSLRNVPIGGGCRKTRRAAARQRSSSPPPAAAAPPKNVVNDNYDEGCFNFATSPAVFECGGGGVIGGDGEDFVYENFGSEMFPNLEGFGFQQAPLMQELEVFSSGGDDEDRVRMSYQNFVTDNWASFDLSAYDNF